MKIFNILVIGMLLILLFVLPCRADFLVVTDKDTDEIMFITDKEHKLKISDDDKTKIKKIWMVGELEDYNLQYGYEYYLLKNKKFIVNSQKISDEYNMNQDSVNKAGEVETITMRLYKDACDTMELEGINWIFIGCNDFE